MDNQEQTDRRIKTKGSGGFVEGLVEGLSL